MKSHPKNNSAPVAPILPTEGVPQKKILLFAACPESRLMLMQEIKKTDHLVVEIVDEPDQLIHEIARRTPHLLVAHTRSEIAADNLIREQIPILFPDLAICFVQGELSANPTGCQQAVQIAFEQPIQSPSLRAYAEGARMVCHDESLHAYAKGKLNRPRQEPGWQKICSRQEARFVLQLQTARKNHASAKHYFLCLLQQQEGLDQEIAYRLAHGSYKALSWSRDLVGKWLALLAHYVPDVELEFLPGAGTPGPKIDFVHHDMPIDGVYAATLILSSKIKPTLEEAIKRVVTARFEGQNEDDLLALSLTLYGMAKLLQQVGAAQIELMDAWLTPSIVDRADDGNIPRGEHRNAGIFRDFYDLGFIVNSPEPLASILRGFHAGTTFVGQEHFFPSFAEFRRICREAHGRPITNVPEQS